ncbi:tail protein [Rhodococcus sp. P27]|nr:tail protein [Rhodococcus sp. P27]
MAINDQAVVTAAKGYVFTGPVGTAAPTPAELDSVDPIVFGSQIQQIKSSGSLTGGTFTISDGVDTSVDLPHNATPGQIQAAIESLGTVGAGNAYATGTLSAGVDVALIGKLQGKALDELTVDSTDLTGGTVSVTVTKAPNGWVNIGHTSRDEMPEFGFDGGDAEVRGTWQNAALREVVTEQAADYLTLFLHQFDLNSFELYYGENASDTPGVFGVAGGTQKANERAFLVIIVDGDIRIGFYASKASVRRDDSISLPVDEFAALPIRATFLKLGANNLFEWISEDLFT